MGNTTSNSNTDTNKSSYKTFEDLYEVVDNIATYYILTTDFQSLKKLSEKEYCNNLVVLTSDIIKKYLNNLDIDYLAQRIKNGVEVNELTKDNVSFLTKDQFDSLDIKNDKQKSIKKKRVCIGIAKFYIKIAHLFAAIVMTLNPVYETKDDYGLPIEVSLMETHKIPKNRQKTVKKFNNICDNRLNSLKNGQNNVSIPQNVGVVNPYICDFNNVKMNNNTTRVKTLADEPGIKELMSLYLDDKYDYSTGTFTGMSNATKDIFMKDLKTFYTAFTGKKDMPPEITKFSDIKLKDYNSMAGCQGNSPPYKNGYTLNKNDKLFINYASNITNMIQFVTTKQKELLDIINVLFTQVSDPYSGKQKIRVNPKLNEDILQKTVEKARKIIIQLYVNCEFEFLNGLKLYETIVESKILQTTESQIKILDKEKKKIVADLTQPQLARTQQVLQRPVVANPIPELQQSPQMGALQNLNENPIQQPIVYNNLQNLQQTNL